MSLSVLGFRFRCKTGYVCTRPDLRCTDVNLDRVMLHSLSVFICFMISETFGISVSLVGLELAEL